MIDSGLGLVPRYKILSNLGAGSFGKVYKAHDVIQNKIVAIKRVIKCNKVASREHKILQKIQSCPYIINYLDTFYTFNGTILHQNLVFEYMPMNLGRYIKETYLDGQIPTHDIVTIMKQILQALSFLKSKKIMHRDIKPENILYDPETKAVKICDFGSSKKKEGNQNTPYIVSRYYRAPELIFGNDEYSYEIDIWAAGCIFLELFSGSPVFKGINDGNQFIQQIYVLGPPSAPEYSKLIEKSNIPPKLIAKIKMIQPKTSIKQIVKDRKRSVEAEDLAKLMLSYDPCNRPTAEECLKHDFFNYN